MVKQFHERELDVCAITVIAENEGLDNGFASLKEGQCEGYNENELLEVLNKLNEVMN